MADPFIGEIKMVGFNFAPQGWAFCAGSLMPIAQNTALFSLLGTQFGGDGRTTFALPDLQGRVPIAMGQGPGLSPHVMGEEGGSESVNLLQTQIPQHSHLLGASSAAGNTRSPGNAVLAKEAAGQTAVYTNAAPDTSLSPASIGPAGGSQPHENMPPYLVINFVIALFGIYPARS